MSAWQSPEQPLLTLSTKCHWFAYLDLTKSCADLAKQSGLNVSVLLGHDREENGLPLHYLDLE